ncbi:hypothetical protein U9M48_037809 [Paspalum notatum var. saurae]|uniref:ATPase inhibitor n=1 Tax=Paspalum notatum var. saurae TaxID=547442 RepID=A0AAQ3UGT3_PASNO
MVIRSSRIPFAGRSIEAADGHPTSSAWSASKPRLLATSAAPTLGTPRQLPCRQPHAPPAPHNHPRDDSPAQSLRRLQPQCAAPPYFRGDDAPPPTRPFEATHRTIRRACPSASACPTGEPPPPVHHMAMRTALTSLPARLRAAPPPAATGARRLLSDSKGRVLSEEERAKESVYIQKMERERLEKLKKNKVGGQENEKPGDTKPADASDKKAEGSN